MMMHIEFMKKIFMKMKKNSKNANQEFNMDYQVDPNIDSIKFIKSNKDTKFTSHLYGDSIVKGNYADTLISVIFNTNNINNTKSIVEKFLSNIKDSSKIQFCIKIDNEDKDFIDIFLKTLSNFKSHFIIIASPRGRGYIDLWQWINFLYKQSSQNSYFLLNISDEMHITTNGWDEKLEKYKSLFEDDIFRLRTSVYKNRNYNNIDECIYAPDTTAIYTRKYIAIQGNFCPCFGPDNGQQIVAYYLARLNYPRHTQFLRDYAINDINFSGEGTSIGLTEKAKMKRVVINYIMWRWTHKYKVQLEYKRRARSLQIEIIKHSQENAKVVHVENEKAYKILIPGKYLGNHDVRESYINLSYKVSRMSCILERFLKINYIKYYTGYDASYMKGVLCHISLYYLKKHPRETFLNVFGGKSNLECQVETQKTFIKFLFTFLKSQVKGITVIKFLFIFLTTPSTLANKTINKFDLSFANKAKNLFVVRFLFLMLKLYEMVINEILIKTMCSFFRFLLDKVIIFRILFNIISWYRKKEKINNIFYYELKSVVLINKKNDESKSLILKGD